MPICKNKIEHIQLLKKLPLGEKGHRLITMALNKHTSKSLKNPFLFPTNLEAKCLIDKKDINIKTDMTIVKENIPDSDKSSK